MNPLAPFNGAPADTAEATALGFCGSHEWARCWIGQRPFASLDAAIDAARVCWTGASPDAKLTAFAAHPRIGDLKLPSAGATDRPSDTTLKEQGQLLGVPEATLTEFKRLNDQYFADHGFIFIVCATGVSATDMLARLRARIGNSVAVELENAAREQGKIMELRMRQHFADQRPDGKPDPTS